MEKRKINQAVEDIKWKIDEAYQFWLMEFRSDEIHCKDHLIEAVEDGRYYEDFCKWVSEEGLP